MIKNISVYHIYSTLIILLCAIFFNKTLNSNTNHIESYSFYIDNPYEGLDWEKSIYLDSMSHQHAKSNSGIQSLIDMKFDHFLISNYYPSKPLYPLPNNLANGEALISGPNAEHHSVSDFVNHRILDDRYDGRFPSDHLPVISDIILE